MVNQMIGSTNSKEWSVQLLSNAQDYEMLQVLNAHTVSDSTLLSFTGISEIAERRDVAGISIVRIASGVMCYLAALFDRNKWRDC